MEFGRLPAAHLGLSVNGQSGEPELGNSMQLRISIVLNVSDKNGPVSCHFISGLGSEPEGR